MSTKYAQYCWPDSFPEGVPEDLDVMPAEGRVYRLVRNIPPTPKDFLMHRMENPDRRYSTDQVPMSYGVSFWTKLSKIQKVKRNYPKPEQFGTSIVVSGNLCNELGVIPKEVASDGHVTLWAQDGAEPHLYVNTQEDEL
ncbi:hypothetical protein [Grimontia hollisae]|uniref:hypothetical protein n=1 Tax=Grimontia hollisae TaxID=673 RepID=UPI00165DA601|nr:hypothetical protein [Grimontia hollisae]